MSARSVTSMAKKGSNYTTKLYFCGENYLPESPEFPIWPMKHKISIHDMHIDVTINSLSC